MYASGNNNIVIVQLLIKAKVDLNIQDNNGLTALMYASCLNHVEIVKLIETKDVNCSPITYYIV